jgi:hypothetical protein
MKKFFWLLVTLSFIFCSAVAFADTTIPAASKVVIIKGGAVFTSGLKFSSDSKNGEAKVMIPLSARQQNGTPQVFIAKNELINGQWVRVSDNEEYKVKTEKSSDGFAVVTLNCSGKRLLWLRDWGKVINDEKESWMDINQADEYCRLDAKGNPGNELIFNEETCEFFKVPKDYPRWE